MFHFRQIRRSGLGQLKGAGQCIGRPTPAEKHQTLHTGGRDWFARDGRRLGPARLIWSADVGFQLGRGLPLELGRHDESVSVVDSCEVVHGPGPGRRTCDPRHNNLVRHRRRGLQVNAPALRSGPLDLLGERG